MTKPIAFIIGAGKNIGLSTAKILQSKGYRIALAARSLKPEDSTNETLHLALDLSKPEAVGPAFASLRKQWGEPSVVFYNGENRLSKKTKLALGPKPLPLTNDRSCFHSRSRPLHPLHRPARPASRRFRHRPCDQHHQLVRRDQRVPLELRQPPHNRQEGFPVHRQHPQHRADAGFADAGGGQSRFCADC